MGKVLDIVTLDGSLDIAAGANAMHLCSGEPANRAAVLAQSLADVVMSAGDFTKAAGAPDGRTLTIAAKTNVDVDANGTGDHVALIDASNRLVVTTCSPTAVSIGQQVNFGQWTYRNADAS